MKRNLKPLIIIAEDDRELAALISARLTLSDMQCKLCHDAAQVSHYLKTNFANLLLLDVHLPDNTGFELMAELRDAGVEIPVIFLTGENAEMQKVKALEMGGDDYITKPFGFPELIARINAVLRRAETVHDSSITRNVATFDEPFEFCGAHIDPYCLQITFPDGAEEKIGRKELGILAHLASNNGTVLTRRNMIHAIWGNHANVRSRSLDQYMSRIREMLKCHNLNYEAFRTVHGVGYIYDPQKKNEANRLEEEGESSSKEQEDESTLQES